MTDQPTLREFQQKLADRLNAAEQSSPPPALLAMESGKDRWLLDLADAGEVVPTPQLAAVPLTKPWYAGLVNVRGNLFSVVDLSRFHGGEPTTRDADSRLLLVGTRHGINSALLVTRVLGLKSLATLEIASAHDQQTWRGDRYRDAQGTHWTHLRIPQLLKARTFLEIGL